MPFDPAHFVTLDRFDEMDRAGSEISHFVAQAGEMSQLDAWRIDLHAQFIDRATGVGAYITQPGAMVESHARVADTDVGFLYKPDLASPALGLVTRLGLALPTSTTRSGPVLSEGMLSRVTDTALAIPGGTTLRASASLLWVGPGVFARGDAGIDGNLQAIGGRVDPIGRAGIGGGFIAGSSAIMAEFVAARANSEWLSTGAISVRIDAGPISAYGAFEFGLDSATRDRMKDAFVLGFDVPLSSPPPPPHSDSEPD